MNGVPQSGADRSATAQSRVRVYCSNLLTVTMVQVFLVPNLYLSAKYLLKDSCRKKETKHSSKGLQRLVSFFLHQSLPSKSANVNIFYELFPTHSSTNLTHTL